VVVEVWRQSALVLAQLKLPKIVCRPCKNEWMTKRAALPPTDPALPGLEPSWDWYRSFLAVLDAGSLSAAARVLGLTQPTLGRHVDQLEQALGLKLFVRSPDGFAPTDAAQELRPLAAGVASNAAALRRAAASHGDGVRGTVRITASEVVGVEVLPPLLARLRARHPALVIELQLSDAVDDLLRRQADIAVRMVRPEQKALVARRAGGVELGLFAQRGYLAANGTPRTPEELAGHAFIGPDSDSPLLRRMLARFPMLQRANLALRTDNTLAHLAAIRAGFGIGICQATLAARDPSLVRVLAGEFSFVLDTWIAMHADLRASPRCAVTFAALVDGLGAHAAGATSL
jgi:DNA-binding transcriptional LysR family regulator